jgi:hypothetical protein
MTAPQTYVQTPAAKAAYDARWQRITDCVNMKQADRMPIFMIATFWLAKYGGITNRQLMYDEKVTEIGEREEIFRRLCPPRENRKKWTPQSAI